ncbi:lysophospholipid acyltransferase family protein [Thermodesulfobacteriota bacterium]
MIHSPGERRLIVLRLIKIVANLALYPFFNIHTSGLANIPTKGSFILLPKHQRWVDIPILGLSVQKPLHYIAKHDLFQNPFSRWFISSLGGIPLNRERPLKSRQSFEIMIRLFRDGNGIVVFPEGTYYRDSMGAGHSGLIRIVLARFSIPLIPVGMKYSGRKGRTSVRIRIGTPVHGDSSTKVNEVIDHTMKEIARLSGL